ncbi:MAG TPA: hypothetical protein VGM56_28535 [Byssovorax sp.]
MGSRLAASATFLACAALLAAAGDARADDSPFLAIGSWAPPWRSTAPAEARPPPLHVDYAQYGVALTINADMSNGALCGSHVTPQGPCIIGSGGGLALRGGYRSPGPWYIGGAYEFTKMDSANLYRLGIFQQARFEMRYMADIGYRAAPFVTWGAGGLLYGNEWGAETGGALAFGGGGVELEVSRTAVMGLTGVYRPALIAGWTDTAGLKRPTGLAQFIGIELRVEIRTELKRR